MLTQTKRWLYNRNLSQRLSSKSSNIKIDSFNPSQRIAILFDATDIKDKSTVQHFADRLSHSDRQVKLLGYYHSKVEMSDSGFTFYNRKNLNWLGIPQNEMLDEFLQREFDILIALIPKLTHHFEFIVKMANAKLKIGPNFAEKDTYFDLIVDVQPSTIENLIENIITTLDKVGH